MYKINRRTMLAGMTLAASGSMARAAEGNLKEVTFAISSGSMGAAATRIANELGLFEKHGLSLKLSTMQGANASTTALISGSVQVAASGPSELILANSRGQNVVVLMATYNRTTGTLVLAKSVAEKLNLAATAPINERLKALDGLLIAAHSPTAMGVLGLNAAIEDAGAKVTYTYVGQTAMPAALDTGVVQGYLAASPYWASSVIKGTGVRWLDMVELPEQFVTNQASHLQVMKTTAEEDPELIKTLFAIFDELADAVENRPDDVRAAVSRLYPDIDKQTFDLIFEMELPAWKTRHVDADQVKHEIDLMERMGVGTFGDLDPNTMVLQQM